ncbi:MIP/aquaporin family protein [Acidihalobacter prosperus]|uniref:Aquaporin Z n=1 Tax=Acidihalobacter prosperus TaxID=160660 RepID=A0A1A6C4N1_9GAMM|nr:MIP/aquaporin family protein [Acidihalobacter prosperus]OBS09518.1 Aquaporin Z [Acidihalobacter prosperus]
MQDLSKALIAEFIGTFGLIFFGGGAAAMVATGHAGLLDAALANGLAVAIAAFVFGDISGGLVNPAITLGAAVAGKLPPARIVPYIAAQIAGGIVAGLILGFVFAHDHSGTHMSPYGDLGATLINTKLTTITGGFVLEMLGTFFLMSTVLHTAMSDRAGAVAPLAIGLTISISVMFFGGLTGASLNPARTIGPAVASGVYTDIWVYLVATPIGAMAAGLLYRVMRAGKALPAAEPAGA